MWLYVTRHNQNGFILMTLMILLLMVGTILLTALQTIQLQWRIAQQSRQQQRLQQALKNDLVHAQANLIIAFPHNKPAPITFHPRDQLNWQPYGINHRYHHWRIQWLYQRISRCPCQRLLQQVGHGLQFWQISIHALQQPQLIVQSIYAIPHRSYKKCDNVTTIAQKQRSWRLISANRWH